MAIQNNDQSGGGQDQKPGQQNQQGGRTQQQPGQKDNERNPDGENDSNRQQNR